MSALRSRLFARAPKYRGPEHGTVVLIRTLLLFESILYAAVTPVLPHYQHEFAASKPAVGLLAASYAAGMLPGTLIGGWISTRAGVRRTTVVGLLLFTVSIAAFGFAGSLAALDALRFVQGAACGCVWGGGLAWAIAIAPRERRGEIIGSVIGAAILGTILGPVLGTVAVAIGTQVTFSAFGAIALLLALWTLRHPEPAAHAIQSETTTPLRSAVTSPRLLLGAWLILLEAFTLGALGTLLPLRLSRFGTSGIAIGATFVLASVASAALAPLIGRLVDRRGAAVPLCTGLVTTAILLLFLPLPHSPLLLAALCVITLGGPLTAYTIPAMSVITDASERLGLAVIVASTLLNLAWASGEMLGAPAAASLSQATSDAVPIVILAVIMALTLVPVTRAQLDRSQAPVTERTPEPTAVTAG